MHTLEILLELANYMLSKSEISFIKSLHQKKFRRQHGLFIVEGSKSVLDFLQSDFQVYSIYFTQQFADQLSNVSANIKLFEVTNIEINKISTLQTPQGVLALVKIPDFALPANSAFSHSITLVLDDVQDPGNLGTIIRTADWFGIRRIICSENTADIFNPKTVQATMGSLSRVIVHISPLVEFLKQQTIPILGACLHGENLYQTDLPTNGFLVLGNEGNGISPAVNKYISKKITIPGAGNTESLNVAISAAIICGELYRKGRVS